MRESIPSFPGSNRRPIVEEMAHAVAAVKRRTIGYELDTATGLPDLTKPLPITKLAPHVTTLQFMYGTPAEIETKLFKQTDNEAAGIFPLIVLVADTPISRGRGPRDTITMHIGIVMNVQADEDSETRRATAMVPVLIPIYNELMVEFQRRKPYFFIQNPSNDMPHTYIEALRWGTDGLFNRKTGQKASYAGNVCAIEIAGLELKLN